MFAIVGYYRVGMELSQDFYDLLAAFEKAGARYLLVGGYAVSIHSKPRYTKDIDLWIDSSADNLVRVGRALEEFGAPAQAITDVQNCAAEEIVWFGNPPARVDILRTIPGLDFAAAYQNRETMVVGGVPAVVISLEDLITAKVAAGRPQDQLDVEVLKASRR